MKKLTENQKSILRRIKKSDGKFIHCQIPYGIIESKPSYYITKPYSEEDARSVNPLIDKGILEYIGDDDYGISEEFKNVRW